MAALSVIWYCIATTAGIPRRTRVAAVPEKGSPSLPLAPSQEFRNTKRREGWPSNNRARSLDLSKWRRPVPFSVKAMRPSCAVRSKSPCPTKWNICQGPSRLMARCKSRQVSPSSQVSLPILDSFIHEALFVLNIERVQVARTGYHPQNPQWRFNSQPSDRLAQICIANDRRIAGETEVLFVVRVVEELP